MTATTRGQSVSIPGARPGGFTLVVVGPGTLRSHPLAEQETLIIGRDESCPLRLDHPRISRRHAKLVVGARCLLEDLGSRNGTQLGGQALVARAPKELGVGDSFSLGPFTLVLVAEGQAAAVTPATLLIDDPAPPVPAAFLVAVATSPLTVLIQGETGVGKEVLAETLHRLSGRSGPLLRLNCASFQSGLLESELFGHERGAFTGAVASKSGLLEIAAGGTVLLDEIGELPLPLQAKLLRAIEAREVLRVGATRAVDIDVRFLAATNRELHAEIAAGRFRLDLYYRLAVVTLTIPPLRERPTRIVPLVRTVAAAAAERARLPGVKLSPGALARLQQHHWPGNVRELRNVLDRALLLAGGAEVRAEHIVIDRPPPGQKPEPGPTAAAARAAPHDDERERILEALARCAGNQTRAAKLLGMARATLVTKLAIHQIPRPRR